MADDVDQHVEDALNTLVSITEKSGNLRKDLRNDILESVCALRKAFSKIKTHLENKNEENKKLNEEVRITTQNLARMRDSRPAGQVTPSLDHTLQTPRSGERQVPASERGRRKLFADVLKGESSRRYTLSLKAKSNNQTVEQIKSQIKREINPTEIKVGIKAFKTLRDRGILIETGSEEEINALSSAISAKLGDQLEIVKHKLRKPRIIIYNVSEDITTDNVTDIIKAQNTEIVVNGEGIEAKFRFKNRKGNYNIELEVGPQTRKKILQTKLKLRWEICNVADYLTPTRCYKCSRYNHKHNECKGEQTCPHCAGKHRINECSATTREYKCINCIS